MKSGANVVAYAHMQTAVKSNQQPFMRAVNHIENTTTACPIENFLVCGQVKVLIYANLLAANRTRV